MLHVTCELPSSYEKKTKDRQTDLDGLIECSSLTPEREEHLKIKYEIK